MIRMLLLAMLIVTVALISTTIDLQQLLHNARHWFLSLGWAGPLLFALMYGCLGALAVPTGLIEVIAGALFGLFVGGAAVLGGALLAANAGFISGRWLARGWIEKCLHNSLRARQIEAAVSQRGFWITTLIRLSPVIPFNLTSYVLGASSIRWLPFLAASLLGMLPTKLLLVWIGADGQKLLSASNPGQWGAQEWLLYGGGSLATVAVVGLIGWIINSSARHALQQAQAGV